MAKTEYEYATINWQREMSAAASIRLQSPGRVTTKYKISAVDLLIERTIFGSM